LRETWGNDRKKSVFWKDGKCGMIRKYICGPAGNTHSSMTFWIIWAGLGPLSVYIYIILGDGIGALRHEGESCWEQCAKLKGRCGWCGKTGHCCKKGWVGSGCDGNMGSDAKAVCVGSDAPSKLQFILAKIMKYVTVIKRICRNEGVN